MFSSVRIKTTSLLLFIIYNLIFSQDIEYAKSVIKDLTDPAFAGRGYVQDGHVKAARYISTA